MRPSSIDPFVVLRATVESRGEWLQRAEQTMLAIEEIKALWLIGSIGKEAADEWSDVDLVVAGTKSFISERAELFEGLGELLLHWDAPQDASPAGMHSFSVYVGEGLAFLVDWHLWTDETAVRPIDARVLFEREPMPTSPSTFEDIQNEIDAKNKNRRVEEIDENQRRQFRLFLLHEVCKDLVRGNAGTAAGVLKWLAGNHPEDEPQSWIHELRVAFEALSEDVFHRSLSPNSNCFCR